MQDKWLSHNSARMILLPARTLGRKHNHVDSLGRKSFFVASSPGRKTEIMDSLRRKRKLANWFILGEYSY